MALTSSAGVLALLDENDIDLQVFALEKLNELVNDFWPEISERIEKIETLYEDEHFQARYVAALLASKVYFHLGEFEDSLVYALNAGSAFDASGNSQYTQTIIALCIDRYASRRSLPSPDAPISPQLESIVSRMFQRCFDSCEFKQAVGVGVETHRLDILERAILESNDIANMLTYALNVAQNHIGNRDFYKKVLHLLCKLYEGLPAPDYANMCQIYISLDDSASTAGVLLKLLTTDMIPHAFQIAFDVYDSGTQHFLSATRTALAALILSTNAILPSGVQTKIDAVLSGTVTQQMSVEFLCLNEHTDKLILKTTKDIITRNSIAHSATVISNSLMYAGTTKDVFLRENTAWLKLATNWAKFSAVASLGVIHKGNTASAMTLLEAYLPKEGVTSSPYEIGGGLYALGLIFANHGVGITEYLCTQLEQAKTEVVQHGACLGLGLAAMGTQTAEKRDVFEALKIVLYNDSAVAGEAAGLAMGLVMLGTADGAALSDMTQYCCETQHEKIIRGLGMGIAFIMLGRQTQADQLIDQLCEDKDALLRMAGVHTIALAYVGTNENKIIRRLLHIAVSDVSDDVRRAAVCALGFVLCRAPAQVPSVVSLLCESFNPHVRYGSCLALGIACAATGSKEAIALIEPMLQDTSNFVRQGALIALALIMVQQPNSHPKSDSIRQVFVKVIADKHEDPLAKFGAIYAQGIIESGGRNVTISLVNESGNINMQAVVGMIVFTQFWFWFPFGHFLSLSLSPTAIICLTAELKMPQMKLNSNAPPSMFAYPPATQPPKEKSKEKVETAVLSITSKALAKKKAAKSSEPSVAVGATTESKEGAVAMEVDNIVPAEPSSKEGEVIPELIKVAPEPTSELLSNPARAVRAQLSKISFPVGARYSPVYSGRVRGGIMIVADSTPTEPETLITLIATSDTGSGVSESSVADAEPPLPFVFDESLEMETSTA